LRFSRPVSKPLCCLTTTPRDSDHRSGAWTGARSALLAVTIFFGATAASLSLPAQASLGAGVQTVELDRQQIQATTKVTRRAAFAVHELQSAGGALVREYVSPSGVVFGVSWGGPTMPNLRQLLGAHFDIFVSSPNRQRGGHGHLVVHEGSLVVESGGHMRSFHGRAYLSDALPTGVTVDDIQ